MADLSICTIPECSKPVHVKSRGLCSTHYQRFLRHGDPFSGGTIRGEPEDFYESKALPADGLDCVFWPYARNEHGYGRMFAKDGGTTLVHRRVCEELHGPPPTSAHEAAHSCGKGHEGCVSGAHVRWATPLENAADMVLHGTSTLKAHGEAHPRAKLTEAEVRAIRADKGLQTRAEVAARYGVKPETIKAIYSRKIWARLK
jgi:hypothetical protein